MSVPIWCNGKRILKIKNTLFEHLYLGFEKIIEEKNPTLPANVAKLIDKTNLGSYGHSGIVSDIADYLKNKNETLLFAQLVKEALEIEKEYYLKVPGAMKIMHNFYEEIMNYANTLP